MANPIPKILFLSYLIFFAFLGIHPYSRDVWIAENTPIVAIVLLLFVLYVKNIRFSNAAYLLMSVLIFLHTVGGHYTFERVPFEWFSKLFGFERNMYDRVAHFTVGFYAFAWVELSLRQGWVRSKAYAYFSAFCFIAAIAASYEIIEWIYAVNSNSASGSAFLGSQGDIWDAQEDMALDMSGGAVALLFYYLRDHFLKKKQS